MAQGQPGGEEPWLDFDPFSNSQTGIETYSLGEVTEKGGLAYVPVNIRYPRDPGAEKMRLRVVLRPGSDGSWKIANVAYPAGDGVAAWDLLSYLKNSFK